MSRMSNRKPVDRKNAAMHKSRGKEDDPAQSKRFIDAARDTGADETEEGADRTFKKVVSRPGKEK